MLSAASANVLILEDEALIAMELCESLAHSGHTVVGVAEDSDEALSVVAHNQVDVALVDIDLRDGPTGVSIASRLVNDHGVVVIFVTANPGSIPDHFCGALGFVRKPFDIQRIGDVVQFAAAVRIAHRRNLPKRPSEISPAPWLRALAG